MLIRAYSLVLALILSSFHSSLAYVAARGGSNYICYKVEKVQVKIVLLDHTVLSLITITPRRLVALEEVITTKVFKIIYYTKLQ